MRLGQEEIISSVARTLYQREALLISAPTGIGKTMAVLYPAVKQALKLGKKLFFLTSKTMQQDAAVEALQILNDGSFRVLRIRAKQKMCAHSEMICHEDFCPYAARYSEKMQRTDLLNHLVTSMSYFDPAITFEMAKSNEVCPFEVSLELIEQADVIVCDYNYIFDPYVGLKAYQQENDYGDCVLIVDEAHNLVDRGRGYYSPELHEQLFERIRSHLAARNCWLDGAEELLEMLRDHFRTLAEGIDEEAGAKQALCEPDRELFIEQRTEWERLIIHYIGWKIDNRIVEEDDPVIDFYFRLMKVANLMTEKGRRVRASDRADAGRPEAEDLLQGSVALPRKDLRLRACHRCAVGNARAVRFLPQAARVFRPIARRSFPCPHLSRAAIARSSSSPRSTRRTNAAPTPTTASPIPWPRSPKRATATSWRSFRATPFCARSPTACRPFASTSWCSGRT